MIQPEDIAEAVPLPAPHLTAVIVPEMQFVRPGDSNVGHGACCSSCPGGGRCVYETPTLLVPVGRPARWP